MKTSQIILLIILGIFSSCNSKTTQNTATESQSGVKVSDIDMFQKVSSIIEQEFNTKNKDKYTKLKKSPDGKLITEIYLSEDDGEEMISATSPAYSLDTVLHADFNEDGNEDALVKVGYTFGSSSLGIMDLYYLFLNSGNGLEFIYKFDNAELALQLISKNGYDYPGRFDLQKIDGNKLTGNAYYFPQYGIANYVTDTVDKMEFTYNKDSRRFELSYSSKYVKMDRVEE